MLDTQTGYPSIDKPWLKYFDAQAIKSELPKGNIYSVLYDSNRDNLSDIAIEYFNVKITYKDLFESIGRVETAFIDNGVRAGDIVTLSMVTTPELIYCLYALAKIGAIANLIDPRLSKEELVRVVSETETRVIVCVDVATEHISKSLLEQGIKIISVSPGESLAGILGLVFRVSNRIAIPNEVIVWKSFIEKSDSMRINQVAQLGDSPMLMTHTSGTTGVPKGVVLSHNNINAVAIQYKYGIEHSRQQRYMAIIPPFIAFGVCVAIHLPLCLGMVCIPIPKFSAKEFYSYLKKYKPNHFTCTPSNLDYLSNDKRKIDLSNLIVPSVGGDYISWKTEEKINKYLREHGTKYDLVKGYGMTEVSSSACTTKNGYNKPGSVGFPLVKMTISIFEPGTDRELKYGEEGEICFVGPNVMLGYYKNEKATDALIRMHSDGKKWVHSGDIGYMDSDGFLYVLDRMKRIINLSNGVKLLPSKIERCILNMDEVEACAVIGHNYGDELKARAYIIKKTEIEECKIKQYCESNLNEDIIPEDIVAIDVLPLTPVGKIDYERLTEIDKKSI